MVDSGSWALAVHGGTDPRHHVTFSAEERQRRHQALESAVQVGKAILVDGGSSLDAVQASVRMLEDAPDFNAGRGAELSSEGRAELDASIMVGTGRRAGAVAGVRRVRNPIDLARCVMDESRHVFLIGDGAEQFAECHQITLVAPDYFITNRRLEELRLARAREGNTSPPSDQVQKVTGTVGAVALDRQGGLSAATSTGGYTNKPPGRVGDSPIIGAGTYAENGVCATSCTGWGEYFIRTAVAYDLCARVKYAAQSLTIAAQHLIDDVHRMGGYGGLIAIDAGGRITTVHSTPRMAYAHVSSTQDTVIVSGDHE